MLDAEMLADHSFLSCSDTSQVDNVLALDGINFKADQMYRHNMMRINYTTYNVRRAQDTINPNTNHCNVMLLSCKEPGSPKHQYMESL
jgi:hypothetical protein